MCEIVCKNFIYCLFLVFGMILPTFWYLVTLGHLVYTSGEYKNQTNTMLYMLMLLMFKIIFLGIILYTIYNWYFALNKPSLVILLWGLILIYDSRYINKLLSYIDNYTNKKSDTSDITFKNYLINYLDKDFKHKGSLKLFISIKIFLVAFLFLTLLGYYLNNYSIIFTDICLPVYVYYDYRLFIYYRNYIEDEHIF